MFGRATIRLGIGPHSSFSLNLYVQFVDIFLLFCDKQGLNKVLFLAYFEPSLAIVQGMTCKGVFRIK